MNQFERYWLFAAACLLVSLFLLRLVLRERITLQGTLSFLLLLAFGVTIAVFPGITSWIASQLGFTLPSNFFFAVCIVALTILHVASRITASRIEIRSIALVQEVAILQERLERALAEQKGE
jgi:hypothetical protein